MAAAEQRRETAVPCIQSDWNSKNARALSSTHVEAKKKEREKNLYRWRLRVPLLLTVDTRPSFQG
jgi:hypothetical protein